MVEETLYPLLDGDMHRLYTRSMMGSGAKVTAYIGMANSKFHVGEGFCWLDGKEIHESDQHEPFTKAPGRASTAAT